MEARLKPRRGKQHWALGCGLKTGLAWASKDSFRQLGWVHLIPSFEFTEAALPWFGMSKNVPAVEGIKNPMVSEILKCQTVRLNKHFTQIKMTWWHLGRCCYTMDVCWKHCIWKCRKPCIKDIHFNKTYLIHTHRLRYARMNVALHVYRWCNAQPLCSNEDADTKSALWKIEA